MNWTTLSAINEIYQLGKTGQKTSLMNDPYIHYLLNSTKELVENGRYLVGGTGFKEFYEGNHLTNYLAYSDFLKRNSLLKPQTRHEESDLKVLIDIEERISTGDLTPLREQILKSNETIRGVSLMFFKNEKYLQSRPSLIEALKKVLAISQFADDRDQQYKYVLECENPELIVLCENIDFLKKPSKPRQHRIELWYAGGKNIDKLRYVDTRGLPIYYSCDWDYDGLVIFALVKRKIPSIRLLFPTGEQRDIIATEHKSHWIASETLPTLSGLDPSLFSFSEKNLIERLIASNSWIIEESNDLIKMIDAVRKDGL
jgi:hypothetical protein